jgi:hypothetical protein
VSASSCSLLDFNLATCVGGTVTGWFFGTIALMPWWGWVLAALIVAGAAYKIAGWLGVAAFAGAVGYGVRAVEDAEHARQKAGSPPTAPPVAKPHHDTIFDQFGKK